MSEIDRFLEGQLALVTGGSTGIGAGCAVELARRGACVGINYRSSEEEAGRVAAACRGFGVEAEVFQADVSDPGEVDGMFSAFKERFGRLDILVANAGMQRDGAVVDLSFEDWQAVIGTNLTGQFLCCQQAVRMFRAQGVNEGVSRSAGKIVCMSSVHDEIPWAGHVNYAASKGGVSLMMQSMALELAGEKIRINAVSPGAIKTEINEEVWGDEKQAAKLRKLIPYGRIGEAEDIARPVAWLVSDAADYVTGTTIYVDGGMTLYPGFLDNG